eukprot:262629_1
MDQQITSYTSQSWTIQITIMYNGHSLEKSFVIITEQLHAQKEIFFLHGQLKKYKYQHYDITSPTPKTLAYNDYDLSSSASGNECKSNSKWTTESLFTPIDGTMAPTNDATNYIIELLNWKICREDYLLKKMNVIQLEYEYAECPIDKSSESENNNMNSKSTDIITDDISSYSNYLTSNEPSTSSSNNIIEINTSDNDEETDEKVILGLSDYGYFKETHLCYTLKGELLVALNGNNSSDSENEEVAIKKMVSYVDSNGFQIVIDARLIKEALITRHLETENTLIKNSIVKYIDFFQIKTHYYSVVEKDFSGNLKE